MGKNSKSPKLWNSSKTKFKICQLETFWMHFKIVPLTHLFWVVVGKMHAAMLNGSCLLDGVPLWSKGSLSGRFPAVRRLGGRTRMWAQLGMWKWKNEILPSSQGISSHMNQSRPHYSLPYDKFFKNVKNHHFCKIMVGFRLQNSWILPWVSHGLVKGGILRDTK